MLRIAIYARYSCDKQSENSTKDQIFECQKFAKRFDGEVVEVYADDAISGTTNLRPDYQRLLTDAAEGKIDLVVAEALDRVTRNQMEVALFYQIMKFHGVEIRTIAEGEINEMTIGLKGTMNAMFSIDLAKKVRRGMEGALREGKSPGNYSYGYKSAPRTDEENKIVTGEVAIVEHEKAIVQRIFEEFADGRSPRQIAYDLNSEGIRGPKGKKWSDTSIRGSRAECTGILNNELYIGIRVWGKTRQVRDPRTGKGHAQWVDKSEWLRFDVKDLAFISINLWLSVKAKQDEVGYLQNWKKKRPPPSSTRRPMYLLSNKVTCGACGGRMIKVGKDAFGCVSRNQHGTCENGKRVSMSALEDVVLNGIKTHLLPPEKIERFLAEYQEQLARESEKKNVEVSGWRKKLGSIERSIGNILKAIENGINSKATKTRLDELEREQADLSRKLEKFVSRKVPTRDLVKQYRDKVMNLIDTIADKSIRHQALAAIRPLIVKITVWPTSEGWKGTLSGNVAALFNTDGQPSEDIIFTI